MGQQQQQIDGVLEKINPSKPTFEKIATSYGHIAVPRPVGRNRVKLSRSFKHSNFLQFTLVVFGSMN